MQILLEKIYTNRQMKKEQKNQYLRNIVLIHQLSRKEREDFFYSMLSLSLVMNKIFH